MRETITMTSREQRRAWVLIRLLEGSLERAEAAPLLGLSERQVRRLAAVFERDGPAALVHGNRGRASSQRIPDDVRVRVIGLATTRYGGLNDCHLAELLAEREGIALSRSSVRRILRGAGIASPRRRRPPRHRRRRERMTAPGLLIQLDGSRHDWLEGRGPWLTLLGAVDDATGVVVGATFRAVEDAAGYLTVLADLVRHFGVPVAVYHDRHSAFVPSTARPTIEDELAGVRPLSQVGRALEELGIASIAARSPQAKGRIERLWGTFQDRLVAELRLAGATDRGGANRVLARFLPRFNRRFGVPPACPEPAWRTLPDDRALERICCLKYRRRVANDHTVRVAGTTLQLPARSGRGSYAGRMVEVHIRLDGRIVAWDGTAILATTAASPDPARLRARAHLRVPPRAGQPAEARPVSNADHPWRRMPIGRTTTWQRPESQTSSRTD
jgi:transposase